MAGFPSLLPFSFKSQRKVAGPFRVTGSTLAEIYARTAEVYDTMPAFATRKRALEWEPTSFRELYEKGRALAMALIDMGVEARDHLGLLGDNRLEWILADYGTQLCGAANVPRGRDVTDREIVYIFRHAGVRTAFVETKELQDRVLALHDKIPGLERLILLDPNAEPRENVHRLGDLVERGRKLLSIPAAIDTRLEERLARIRPDDLFTLIYTSGTTGDPKGVMLTHANIISQLENIPLEVNCTDRVVSILPVWHIFERVFEMLAISRGCCTYYSNIRTLADDIRNVEPTFMGSAPRMWENMHQRILKSVQQKHPVRRALFHIAYFLSHYYKESAFHLSGRQLDLENPGFVRKTLMTTVHAARWFLLLPWYGFFNAAVLEQLRLGAGGALKGSISGGGALPKEVDQFFNYIGIPVLEGYGLTESAPVIAVRTYSKLVIGTVGPVIPHTDLRIVCLETGATLYPDASRRDLGRGRKGEIAVRGPQVMSGYYNNPEATKHTLRNGWLHTGDIGLVTFNDCLKIVGRCKETIVLSSGENLEPSPIEMQLCESPLIEHCMVVGQDRRFAGALIVPSIEGFAERGIHAASHKELACHPEAAGLIGTEIRQRISEVNGFKGFERIRTFYLLADTFSKGEELTNLFKLKRHVVAEKFKPEIEAMYRRSDNEHRPATA